MTPRITLYPGGKVEAWNAGWGAQNNLFRIRIWRDYPNALGVLAQEVYEWRYKWLRLLLAAAAIIAGAIAAYNLIDPQAIYGLCLTPLALLAGQVNRGSELKSHAIEIMCGILHGTLDIHIADYEEREARSMVRYPHLRGMSEAEILAGVRANYPEAEDWVLRNGGTIAKLKSKLGVR